MDASRKVETYIAAIELQNANIGELHDRVKNGVTLEEGEFVRAYELLARLTLKLEKYKARLSLYEEEYPALTSPHSTTITSQVIENQPLTNVSSESPPPPPINGEMAVDPFPDTTQPLPNEEDIANHHNEAEVDHDEILEALNEINSLQCSDCGAIFSRTFTLRRHREREVCKAKLKNDKQCETCNKKFSSQRWLNHHKKNAICRKDRSQRHRQSKCDSCNHIFNTDYNLQQHIESGVCGRLRNPPPHKISITNVLSSSTIFTCTSCSKRFDTQFFLDAHLLSHSSHNDSFTNDTCTLALHKYSHQRLVCDYLMSDSKPVYDAVFWLEHNKILIDRLLQYLDKFMMKAMLVVNLKFAKINKATGDIEKNFNFYVSSGRMDMVEDNDLWFDRHLSSIKTKIENMQENESNLEFLCIQNLTMKITLLENRGGKGIFNLPKPLQGLQALINVNATNDCFKYAILSILHYHDIERDRQRVSQYAPFENELNFDKLDSNNMKIKDIPLFEKQNKIKVNIHVWDKKLLGVRYNSRITNDYKRSVNLLLVYDDKENKSHYVGITNISRLYKHTESYDEKFYYCDRCLRKFTVERLLKTHYEWCMKGKLQIESLPKSAEYCYKENGSELSPVCVLYSDIECYIDDNNQHKAAAIGVYEKWHDHLQTKSTLHTWEGEDCILQFLNYVDELTKHLHERIDDLTRQPMSMTRDDYDTFNSATHCSKCNMKFGGEKCKKVRDHDHITGKFRSALCSRCNLSLKMKRRVLPIVFHNFKSYDAHLIITEGLGKMKEWKLDVIAQTKEKFMNINVKIPVGQTFDEKTIYSNISFIDSFQMMPSSLANLAKNLETFPITNTLKNSYPYVNDHILKRKGVFPYSYFKSLSQLQETSLPSREHFQNDLTGEECSKDDYTHAQLAWKKFECRSFGDYMIAYLKLDIYLLADVFEQFRKVALSEDQLDPVHFISLPSLSYMSAFKMTNETIHLLQDFEMYSLFERGIRGGLTFVNRHLSVTKHSKDEETYLRYIDQNNLYGSSLSKPLPHSNFRWITDDEINHFSDVKNILSLREDDNIGYVFELDLHYPDNIKDKTADFPLAPESGYVSEEMFSPYMINLHKQLNKEKYKATRKLLLTQFDKENYIVHYSILKFYIEMGMQLKTIHRAIAFTQKPFFKKYIDYNSSKRQKASNSFEKDYYKLKNNALFGKTMEDVRKRINYKLVTDMNKLDKICSSPLYHSFDTITDEICGIKMTKQDVLLNKPIYIGQAVLDYSKLEMYNLFYKTLKTCPKIKHVQLEGGDTDSFFLSITIPKNETINNIFTYLKPYFDSSNFPTTHPLFSNQNKAKLGCFKDECAGKEIEEMILLRPKMYSMKYKDSDMSIKRAKGISKSIVQKMKHSQYKNAFVENITSSATMTIIKSFGHKVSTHTFNKRGLSPWDDKRCWISKNISLPHGHPDTYIPPPKKRRLSIPPCGDVD